MKSMCSANPLGLLLISTYRLESFRSHKCKAKPYFYDSGNVKIAKKKEKEKNGKLHTPTDSHPHTHTYNLLSCHKNIQNILRHLNKFEALKICYVY